MSELGSGCRCNYAIVKKEVVVGYNKKRTLIIWTRFNSKKGYTETSNNKGKTWKPKITTGV